jgi:diguanylate cyclase (GGDEF)-like protein/PAS domain S-box-containing protein
MPPHAPTPDRHTSAPLARWARAKAGYALGGILVLLVAFATLTLLRLSSDTRAHAEADLAASQVDNDLGWLIGLSLQARQSGSTPTIMSQVAQRGAGVHMNLRKLAALRMDTDEVASLAADADSLLAGFNRTIPPAPQANAGGAGPQVLPLDPAQVTLLSNRLVQDLQASAAATAAPRRLALVITLPAIALLLAVVLWGESRRRRNAVQSQAEAASHARFEALVEQGSDLVVLADKRGVVSYVSSSLTHVLGIEPASWLGRQGLDLILAEDRAAVAEAFQRVALVGKSDPMDVRFLHADGTWRLLELAATDLSSHPQVGCVVWHGRDVTERRRLEEELAHQAFRDSLTGLANRALFQDRLTQALARVARSGEPVGVLMLDLDGFKTVNDSMGHEAGDEVLVEVAARLGACVRPGDTVARRGGDEFTILLENMGDPSVIELVAGRVAKHLRKPLSLRGHELHVSASIGMALSSDKSESAQRLLRNADLAMYVAKSRGRDNQVRFEASMHADAEDALGLSLDLSGALARGELFIHYQPTMSLVSGELEGAEALLRWNHPDRGVVPPLAFIPLAEQSGEIVAIGRWILQQACEQAARWTESFPGRTFSMNVNVSGRQLLEPNFVHDVASILDRTGLGPHALTLEITETIFVTGAEAVIGRLEELKALGIKLAIDDFGTGYSSLAYLGRFPFDIMKIDKGFVDAASTGAAGGEALIKAIVDLGAGLHLKTVAEGIERSTQASHMRELGCDAGQGYFFARPMAAGEFTQLLTITDRASLILNPLSAVQKAVPHGVQKAVQQGEGSARPAPLIDL